MLNGYRVIHKPDALGCMTSDNWNGWIYEHIHIAQQLLGRSLRESEVVHHLNGDRADNRAKNLLVLERSQHTKLHAWINAGAPYSKEDGEKRVNSGKSKVDTPIFCECGRTVQSGTKYCSQKCSSFASRKVSRPDAEQLKLDIDNLSWVAIGRKYGVSDNAVRNWARKYNLL